MGKASFLILVFLFFMGCSDPLSREEEGVLVKTLYDGPLAAGRYVVFWDGTGDDQKFVQAGTYYARLYSRDFTFQIEMTAQDGGTGVPNDSSLSDPGYQPLPGLEQNRPNPFKIRNGTNLPFTLDNTYTIRLTVRNRD